MQRREFLQWTALGAAGFVLERAHPVFGAPAHAPHFPVLDLPRKGQEPTGG